MNESEWTRKVCSKLQQAGATIIVHAMGKFTAHVMDRSIICKHGNFFVEFKGVNTRWTDGQQLLAKRINVRYPCAFLYRQPGILSIGDAVVEVDALENPHEFLNQLSCMQVSQFIPVKNIPDV